MKILVVSDSHGVYSTFRSIVRRQSKAEVVLFLGDGEQDYNTVRMEFPEKMFIGVRGNNDWCSMLKNTELITIEGVKILAALIDVLCHVRLDADQLDIGIKFLCLTDSRGK